MKTEFDISVADYVDKIVDMYYWSFDYINRKFSRDFVKNMIKYKLISNYLYKYPILDNDDIRKKYIFIIVLKFLSIKDYLYFDHHIHTLRGEIQTLLFKEQAKRLADTFIGEKNEERMFNEFKTFVKKDFITNFLSYK